MASPLRKRFPRELKNNLGKYLGIFLLMSVTIALTSGFLLAAHSIGVIIDDMPEKYSIEDARFTTAFEATDEQLDDLLGVVGADKHVFFVNTRSPQSWMAETNAALDRAAERYGNVQVIDWYSLSSSHGTWFDGDGTHLSSEGAQAYIDMVHDAIGSLLPEHKEGDQVAHAETPMEAATSKAIAAQQAAVASIAANIANSLGEHPQE